MQMCASDVQVFFEYPYHCVRGALVQCQISQKYHPTRRICCQLLERISCHPLSTFGLQWPQWPKMDRKQQFSYIRIFDIQTKKKPRQLTNQVGPQRWSGPPRNVRAKQKTIFFIILLHEHYQISIFTARTESKLT